MISANPYSFHSYTSWGAHKKFKSAVWADPENPSDEIDEKRIEAVMEDVNHDVFHPNVLLDFFEQRRIPGERYILHFIPPHLPFIGEKGKKLFKKLGLTAHPSRNAYAEVAKYGNKGNWKEEAISKIDTKFFQ